ncbi:MAG: endonuclease [Clostridia bacterium]|nr:endonuclease [Clostridia bacterium]
MFKSKRKFNLVALILPLCILMSMVGCWVGVFAPAQQVVESVEAASYDSYYAGLNENLTGDSFRTELATLITSTHDYNPTYDGLRNIFDESDADPNKSGNILWFYTGTSVSFNGSFSTGTNREHVWPKNSGSAFPAESEAGSDAHHLRPTNSQLNSTRSNNSFGEVPQTTANIVKENGSTSYANLCYQQDSVFYPGVGYRGATARILMYVQTRWGDKYNLTFVLGKGNNKTIGDIEDLMKWHVEEPPTEAEKARNEAVYAVQGNRNPFIDHPEYAEMIYCHDGESYSDELQNVVETYGSYLDGDVGGDSTIEPTEVVISPSTASLVKGETYRLSAEVYQAGATSTLNWTSSNTSVATVEGGVVTAVGAGSATITATSTANSSVKATATISVKAVSSIALTGAPVKTTYSAGDTFNPTGITVTATYSDGSTATIPNEDCSWLDGTSRAEALSQGSTTVICKYGTAEKTISGITVKQATTKTLTITRESFSGSGAYNWCTWSADGMSGQGFMYPGQTGSIQMNSSKTAQYIFNTTAFSGGIVSITIKSTAEKPWSVYTSSTAYGTGSGKVSTGTKRGTLTSSSSGGTLNIGTTDQYFAINYESTGVVYVEEITIVYGSTHAHTAGEWIVDSKATCSGAGSRHTECTECGEIVDVEVIPALEHSYGTWSQTTAPTCTTDGVEESLCSSCGNTITREVNRLGHDLEAVENSYIAPTCTADGYEGTYACVREGCNHSEVGDSIPSLGHSYGAWSVVTEPTCKTVGSEQRVCPACSDVETREVPTIPHAFGEWTPIENDMEQRVCADCSHTEERAQANDEVVASFAALVEAVESANGLEAKWNAIGEALEAYAELSDSEKDASSEAYATLVQEINAYNQTATQINQQAEKATHQSILFYIGAVSALAYAAWFLIRKA